MASSPNPNPRHRAHPPLAISYYPLLPPYCTLTALFLPLTTPNHPFNRWDDGIELPARLYYSETARGPGLAVSRSLGDVLAHSAGHTHAAEVTKLNHPRTQTPHPAHPPPP
jgi:hypothetical protein